MTTSKTLTYFTFGVQYRREGPFKDPHPLAPWADCEGYLLVVAPSHEAARHAVIELLGRAWAFDYFAVPDPKWCPLGELAHLEVADDGVATLTVHPWGEELEMDDIEREMEIDGIEREIRP